MKIKLIAIIGKSASGKDFLVKGTLADYPKLNPIIHYTTRPRRVGEIDGKDYFFITKQALDEKGNAGEIFTSTCFNNWYYAIGKDSFDPNKINIGVFNPAELKILIKAHGDKFDLHVIKTEAAESIRFNRSIKRLEPFDGIGMAEIARREIADKEDFKPEQLEGITYHDLWTHGNKYYFDYIRALPDTSVAHQTIAEIFNRGYMAGLVESLGYFD